MLYYDVPTTHTNPKPSQPGNSLEIKTRARKRYHLPEPGPEYAQNIDPNHYRVPYSSKKDQMLWVKKGKYKGFCLYRRSYLLWSSLLIKGLRAEIDLGAQTAVARTA